MKNAVHISRQQTSSAADRLDDEVHAFMHQHQHPHDDPVFQVLLAHEPRSRSLACSRRRPH
jgi:hypothetical protein